MFAAILCTCVSAGCRTPSTTEGNILLISIDTLRADHMATYGYARRTTPNVDEFFSHADVFERAYATSSYTSASMISVLSGLLPQHHRVRLFDQLVSDDVRLITEMLPERFQVTAFVSNGVLSDAGLGIASRFDHFDESMVWRSDPPQLERDADATTDAALDWLDAEYDRSRPLFMWVHYMDPHRPYDPPSPWDSKFDRDLEGENAPEHVLNHKQQARAASAFEFIDNYDREIAYTDAAVGRLLDRFSAIVGLDGAMVVFTADHGETLAERYKGSFQHASAVYEEQVRVPLMVRVAGSRARRVAIPVSGIDVLPTMLSFAGVRVPTALTGVDLLEPAALKEDRVVFSESLSSPWRPQKRAATRANEKWVVGLSREDGRVSTRSLYDLNADPGETAALPWRSSSGPGEELLSLVATDPDPGGKPEDPRRGELNANHPALLRLLGYVE